MSRLLSLRRRLRGALEEEAWVGGRRRYSSYACCLRSHPRPARRLGAARRYDHADQAVAAAGRRGRACAQRAGRRPRPEARRRGAQAPPRTPTTPVARATSPDCHGSHHSHSCWMLAAARVLLTSALAADLHRSWQWSVVVWSLKEHQRCSCRRLRPRTSPEIGWGSALVPWQQQSVWQAVRRGDGSGASA